MKTEHTGLPMGAGLESVRNMQRKRVGAFPSPAPRDEARVDASTHAEDDALARRPRTLRPPTISRREAARCGARRHEAA